jgi:uncharacterized repeat protein (TIGR04138 family)
MPAKTPEKSLQEVVDAVGVYPADAYLFVQQGLSYTVEKIHGDAAHPPGEASDERSGEPAVSHHISGRDLCLGLRDVARDRWGLLARVVLERWNITTTLDFGRIVFAMVEHNFMHKTDDDNLLDFRQVYDFHAAFEREYRISGTVAVEKPRRAGTKS